MAFCSFESHQMIWETVFEEWYLRRQWNLLGINMMHNGSTVPAFESSLTQTTEPWIHLVRFPITRLPIKMSKVNTNTDVIDGEEIREQRSDGSFELLITRVRVVDKCYFLHFYFKLLLQTLFTLCKWILQLIARDIIFIIRICTARTRCFIEYRITFKYRACYGFKLWLLKRKE